MRILAPLLLIALLILGCKPEKKYHDVAISKHPQEVTDLIADILRFQEALDAEYKNPETSPLPDRYRIDFEGLDFYDPDTTFVVVAQIQRTPDALPFLMPTTTDRKSTEVVYGIAHFMLKGQKYQLEIYQNKELMLKEGYSDYLFLPFTDVTNGEGTYTGGRYIDLRIPTSDKMIINFNKAYNPYCAYNKKYSCPIVPSVNALNVKIVAGVKAFEPEEK